MGANKRNIQKSINILIEKGYLIPDSTNCRYIFKEDVTLNDLCAKSSQTYVQKAHRNITSILQDSTLDNSDADAEQAADAASEQTNEQSESDVKENIQSISLICII